MKLSNLRVVLVNTTHPGNIGASARAMKTMGITHLSLVNPQGFPCAEATARAAGADDLLYQAQVAQTLDEALADCTLVVGSSARRRDLSSPMLGPRECAELVAQHSPGGPVALLFGQERIGLTNEELDRCHAYVQIPTDASFSSLNLAAAVQVLCYEMRMWQAHDSVVDLPDSRLATGADMDRLYTHLEAVLVALEFLDPAKPRRLMRRLRRLFNRARLEDNEVNILRGILAAVESRCTRHVQGQDTGVTDDDAR